ncbi:MAG TPA: PAS domain-containing protein [Gemmatimonadaceae bacterium]|nr:PAS domain-containing protein [Gemmatimonadaceae bacterium]
MEKPKDGLWIIDAAGVTVYANAPMAEILGTRESELLGTRSFDWVFPEDVADAQRLFEAKKRGALAPFRFKLRRKDNTPTWVNIQAAPLQNADGTFTGLVGTFTPIDDPDSSVTPSSGSPRARS